MKSERPDPRSAPRLRKDAARNRERIVGAARREFATGGIDASLEQVARSAGVAIGTLYRHFPTRVDLLLAAFEEKFDSFMAAADAALAAEDPWVGLSSYLEALCGMQAGDRGFNDFVSMRFPACEETEAMHDRVCDVMERILVRAREAGAVRRDLTIADLITVTWANSRIIEATAGIAPDAWRRHLLLMLDAFRPHGEAELGEPPLTDGQLYQAMARLSS
ncbi:TetR family transcriptional regulator [Streptomyces sulfonofaciens]|uniref:TetR family transcriptional regulator n=1 Tax=Streptomyces sulfonofaciens TaxID=68272 RepID=A0A919GRH6_9ACTN|nr:TetR/AcrR family transcriptional regulator [Streptomyces sulfonofaciens]GHH88711.1 TetR family transcriptional regulator [Streptomyces sulfonofaciens]